MSMALGGDWGDTTTVVEARHNVAMKKSEPGGTTCPVCNQQVKEGTDELEDLRKVVADAAVGLYEALESGEGMNLPSMVESTELELRATCEKYDIPMMTPDWDRVFQIEDGMLWLLGRDQFRDWSEVSKEDVPMEPLPKLGD